MYDMFYIILNYFINVKFLMLFFCFCVNIMDKKKRTKMTNIYKLNDYHKQKVNFKFLSYFDYIEKYPEFLKALSHNDIDNVIDLFKKLSKEDNILYNSCLVYAANDSNLELFKELVELDQKINLFLIFENIFGENDFDLLEIALISFIQNDIDFFLDKLSDDDYKTSLLEYKNRGVEQKSNHAIFDYPEFVLKLKKRTSINLSDLLLSKDLEDEELYFKILSTNLNANEIIEIANLIEEDKRNKIIFNIFNNVFDVNIAKDLINHIEFYKDGKLNVEMSLSNILELKHEVFIEICPLINFKDKELFKNFENILMISNNSSRFLDVNLNLTYIFEFLVKDLKENEYISFFCDVDSDVSLLDYLLANKRLFDKYEKYINLKDLYVKHKIKSTYYQPLIKKLSPNNC